MTRVPDWMIYLGSIGAALIAVGVLWRVALAFIHAFNKIEALTKVIDPVIEMANDFKENGGSTLKDAVNRIDAAATTAVQVSARNQQEVTRLSKVVDDAAKTTADTNKLVHELKGHIASLPSFGRASKRRTDTA